MLLNVLFCSFGGVPIVGRARVVGTFHVHEGPEWREKASGFASEPGGLLAALCPEKRHGLGPFPPLTTGELLAQGFALIE